MLGRIFAALILPEIGGQWHECRACQQQYHGGSCCPRCGESVALAFSISEPYEVTQARRSHARAQAENQLQADLANHAARAAKHIEKRNFKAALKECDRAIRRSPKWSLAWSMRGLACFEMGDLKRAHKDLTKAIDLNWWQSRTPEHARPYCYRGRIYLKQGNERKALADLGKAIRIDSRFAPPLLTRAEILIRQQNHRGALKDLNRVIRIERRSAEAYFLRGGVHRKLEKHKQADADFKKAGKLDKRYRDAATQHKPQSQKSAGSHSPTAKSPQSDLRPVGPLVAGTRQSSYKPYDAWKLPNKIVQQQTLCGQITRDALCRQIDAWSQQSGFKLIDQSETVWELRRGSNWAGLVSSDVAGMPTTVRIERLNDPETTLRCTMRLSSELYSFNDKDNRLLSEQFDKLIEALIRS